MFKGLSLKQKEIFLGGESSSLMIKRHRKRIIFLLPEVKLMRSWLVNLIMVAPGAQKGNGNNFTQNLRQSTQNRGVFFQKGSQTL